MLTFTSTLGEGNGRLVIVDKYRKQQVRRAAPHFTLVKDGFEACRVSGHLTLRLSHALRGTPPGTCAATYRKRNICWLRRQGNRSYLLSRTLPVALCKMLELLPARIKACIGWIPRDSPFSKPPGTLSVVPLEILVPLPLTSDTSTGLSAPEFRWLVTRRLRGLSVVTPWLLKLLSTYTAPSIGLCAMSSLNASCSIAQ